MRPSQATHFRLFFVEFALIHDLERGLGNIWRCFFEASQKWRRVREKEGKICCDSPFKLLTASDLRLYSILYIAEFPLLKWVASVVNFRKGFQAR